MGYIWNIYIPFTWNYTGVWCKIPLKTTYGNDTVKRYGWCEYTKSNELIWISREKCTLNKSRMKLVGTFLGYRWHLTDFILPFEKSSHEDKLSNTVGHRFANYYLVHCTLFFIRRKHFSRFLSFLFRFYF